MLRSEIEEEIGRLLSDPNHDRWSTATLRDRIEFAQTEVQALTGAVKTTETLTPTADTNEVTAANDVLDITRVTYVQPDGTELPLNGRSIEDLDFYVPNWRNLGSSLPTDYSWDASNRQIILVPAPSSEHISSDNLKVWEVQVPTALASDSDEPFDSNVLMRAYTMSVIHWVVAQCWMDDATPEALAKSRFHKSNTTERPGEFEKVIKKINAKFTNPSVIPARIKYMPQGGMRGGGSKWPSKSYPFA